MAIVSNWFREQVAQYPDPTTWRKHPSVGKDDVYRFARLWLFEGIPFAFRNKPAVYELAREKFALVAEEHPRSISITGSGRIGFSMAGSKFGKPFDHSTSDFDLFLVSPKWFDLLKFDAEMFVSRFSAGLAVPKTAAERLYWPENARLLSENASRGFLDHKKIPNYDRYKGVQKLWKACSAFSRTVRSEMGVDVKVSVRVYKGWDIAERQIGGSLVKALGQAGFIVAN